MGRSVGKPRKIVLTHRRAPGDTLVLSALIRDIALSRPGEFEIDVKTTAMDLWRHNPYITPLAPAPDVEQITITYGHELRHDHKYEPLHFLAAFHRNFKNQCNVEIPLLLPRPDLHLSDEERNVPLIDGRYWAIVAGGKSDFTVKVWSANRWQRVVDRLRDLGLGVVQMGAVANGHWHPTLRGVLNLVGRTSLRDMIRVIQHADGVICGVTCAMHMAAALEKPCVVIAGGREAWWWEAYVPQNKGFLGCQSQVRVPHKFLHTIGLLSCCEKHGCLKNKVVPLHNDRQICLQPVQGEGQTIPRCLDMIQPAHVMEAVMEYYTDGSLPPIREMPPETASVETPNSVAAPLRISLRQDARLENNNPGAPIAVPGETPSSVTEDAYDHPDVGGKFTVCLWMYGDDQYHQLHARCLQAILATVPPSRMDLRVATSDLGPQSTAYLNRLCSQDIATCYTLPPSTGKYAAMRTLFWDPAKPITTKWVIWFDDDSIADRDHRWLAILSQQIVQFHKPQHVHVFGTKLVWSLAPAQRDWLASRSWWRDRDLYDAAGKVSPTGNKLFYVHGGWWTVSADAIRVCDLPDPEADSHGGDIVIGAALHQNGFVIKSWNTQRQFINTSVLPNRTRDHSQTVSALWPKHPRLFKI